VKVNTALGGGAGYHGAAGETMQKLKINRLAGGDVFGFLASELGADVDLSRLTDVDRLKLSGHWRMMADGYETRQFHVNNGGLALLVAYLLHMIACMDYVPPR
jgi:hypothetical protein